MPSASRPQGEPVPFDEALKRMVKAPPPPKRPKGDKKPKDKKEPPE